MRINTHGIVFALIKMTGILSNKMIVLNHLPKYVLIWVVVVKGRGKEYLIS